MSEREFEKFLAGKDDFIRELWAKIDLLTDTVDSLQADRYVSSMNYAIVIDEVRHRLGEKWSFDNDGRLVSDDSYDFYNNQTSL